MEPQERTVSPLHQWRRTTTSGPEEDHSRSRRSNRWAECREKNIGIGPMESTFLLTSLLIGPLRTTGCLKTRSPSRRALHLLGPLNLRPNGLPCTRTSANFVREAQASCKLLSDAAFREALVGNSEEASRYAAQARKLGGEPPTALM